MSGRGDDIVWAGFGCCAGAGLFWKGLRDVRIGRAISNLPTSKARSVAMGPAELIGTAASLVPITDPVYRKACVYYRVDVEKKVYSGGSRGRRADWVNIYHVASDDLPLLLVDETGQIPIHPRGAELYCKPIKRQVGWLRNLFSGVEEPVAKFLGSMPGAGGDFRLTAYILREKEPLYVLGYAAQNDQSIAATQAYPAVIRNNPDGFFVLSDESERKLAFSLAGKAGLFLFGGPVLAVGCAAYLAWRLELLNPSSWTGSNLFQTLVLIGSVVLIAYVKLTRGRGLR